MIAFLSVYIAEASLGEIDSISPLSAQATVQPINKIIKLNRQNFEKTHI
jgi:hypothetical protein